MLLKRQLSAEEMCDLYRNGRTLQEIATEAGVTRQRVHAMLSLKGIRRHDGGAFLRKQRRIQASRARTSARLMAIWGCDEQTWRVLRGDGPYRRSPLCQYITQRANARARGIAWEFTLADWWALWQASGRWGERGRGRYVMARYGDVGPYSPTNVHIITSSENVKEAVVNHARRGHQWGAARRAGNARAVTPSAGTSDG